MPTRLICVVLTILTFGTIASSRSNAQATETILYSFSGASGSSPDSNLIFDSAGNLYGTTNSGGAYGLGTVFELSPQIGGTWIETVIHSFGSGTDGATPYSGLIFDAASNLYGTTVDGGRYGYGTIFEMSAGPGGSWNERVLHSFGSGKDGSQPVAGLILDSAGNLYGTTFYGGAYGKGTAFELTPPASGAKETILHNFGVTSEDGENPYGGLVFDASGNLYGTTYNGGIRTFGTAFELSPKSGVGWSEKLLISFCAEGGPCAPESGLIMDQEGNLYGTSLDGGMGYCFGETGDCGTVFELSPKSGGGWSATMLYKFGANRTDGYFPTSDLVIDASGNLYGTTSYGGASAAGTVYELTQQAGGRWTESILHSFEQGNGDGEYPYGSVILDSSGNLYGTTVYGGSGSYGTVYEITP